MTTNYFAYLEHEIELFPGSRIFLSNPSGIKENNKVSDNLERIINFLNYNFILYNEEDRDKLFDIFQDGDNVLDLYLNNLNSYYNQNKENLSEYAVILNIRNESTDLIDIMYRIEKLFETINFMIGSSFEGNPNQIRFFSCGILGMKFDGMGEMSEWLLELNHHALEYPQEIYLEEVFTKFIEYSNTYGENFFSIKSPLENVLEIIYSFSSSMYSTYNFVGMVSIIELLLTHNPNYNRFNVEDSITQQFTQKTLFLLYLSDNSIDLDFFKILLKTIYGIRSNIAHGSICTICAKGNTFYNYIKSNKSTEFESYTIDEQLYFFRKLYYITCRVIEMYIKHRDFCLTVK